MDTSQVEHNDRPDRVDMLDLLGRKIELAKAGDAAAARWLIKQFCSTIKRNRLIDGDGKKIPHHKPSGSHTQFDERLLDYLGGCLSRIGDFDSNQKPITADVALNIAQRAGKGGRTRAASTRAESLRRGALASDAYEKRAAGVSQREVFEEIAERESKSADLIAKDYMAWLELVRSIE